MGPEVAPSCRRRFAARQKCFESRHFEVKGNGGVPCAGFTSRRHVTFDRGCSSHAERKRPLGGEAPPTALIMAILVVEPTHALPDLDLWHRRDLVRHQLRLPLATSPFDGHGRFFHGPRESTSATRTSGGPRAHVCRHRLVGPEHSAHRHRFALRRLCPCPGIALLPDSARLPERLKRGARSARFAPCCL
jgi:hypothetical protein